MAKLLFGFRRCVGPKWPSRFSDFVARKAVLDPSGQAAFRISSLEKSCVGPKCLLESRLELCLRVKTRLESITRSFECHSGRRRKTVECLLSPSSHTHSEPLSFCPLSQLPVPSTSRVVLAALPRRRRAHVHLHLCFSCCVPRAQSHFTQPLNCTGQHGGLAVGLV